MFLLLFKIVYVPTGFEGIKDKYGQSLLMQKIYLPILQF